MLLLTPLPVIHVTEAYAVPTGSTSSLMVHTAVTQKAGSVTGLGEQRKKNTWPAQERAKEGRKPQFLRIIILTFRRLTEFSPTLQDSPKYLAVSNHHVSLGLLQ